MSAAAAEVAGRRAEAVRPPSRRGAAAGAEAEVWRCRLAPDTSPLPLLMSVDRRLPVAVLPPGSPYRCRSCARSSAALASVAEAGRREEESMLLVNMLAGAAPQVDVVMVVLLLSAGVAGLRLVVWTMGRRRESLPIVLCE